MATIVARKRRGRTSYTVRIRLKGHPSITKTFPTRLFAKQWAQQTESDVRSGNLAIGIKRSVSEAIDAYIDSCSSLPKGLPQGRRMQLETWRAEIGDLRISEVTRPVLFAARKKLLKGRQPATVNRLFAALSAVMADAISEGWIPANPVSDPRSRGGKKLKLPEPPGRSRFLSTEEFTNLLTACRHSKEPALYAFVLAAVTTGCRASELQRLAREDIRDQQAIIHKTKNSQKRTVFLSEELLAEIDRLAAPIAGGIFANASGLYPFRYNKAFKIALEKAGIEDFRFHDLRHTCASFLAMSGTSLIGIQTILGHKSAAMTLRYAHLTVDHQAEEHQKMVKKFL